MPLLTVPIADIAAATPRSRLLRLDLTGHALPFRAGQAVMAAAHGNERRRPYSIACSPEHAREWSRLELLVAAEGRSDGGPRLSQLAVGALVDVEGPFGDFTFPSGAVDRRLLFVAGGTGIAPLRAMLDHALRQEEAPAISVLYSARRSDEFAFIEELRGLMRAGLIELHQTVTRDAGATPAVGRGRIGRAHFAAVLHEPADTLCFVCGPPQLVTESIATLSALGVPADQIRTEQWGR